MNVFQLVRLYLRERKIIDQLKRELSMKLSTHVVSQIFLLLLQGINQAEPILSPNGKFWATTIIGVIQVILAILGHLSDQQGDPLPPIKK